MRSSTMTCSLLTAQRTQPRGTGVSSVEENVFIGKAEGVAGLSPTSCMPDSADNAWQPLHHTKADMLFR